MDLTFKCIWIRQCWYNCIKNNKNWLVISAPTGCGKSWVAATLASAYGAVILTSTNDLQGWFGNKDGCIGIMRTSVAAWLYVRTNSQWRNVQLSQKTIIVKKQQTLHGRSKCKPTFK